MAKVVLSLKIIIIIFGMIDKSGITLTGFARKESKTRVRKVRKKAKVVLILFVIIDKSGKGLIVKCKPNGG